MVAEDSGLLALVTARHEQLRAVQRHDLLTLEALSVWRRRYCSVTLCWPLL